MTETEHRNARRKRTRYEILENGVWVPVRKGQPKLKLRDRLFLHYEIREADDTITIGLARPGTWREVEQTN